MQSRSRAAMTAAALALVLLPAAACSGAGAADDRGDAGATPTASRSATTSAARASGAAAPDGPASTPDAPAEPIVPPSDGTPRPAVIDIPGIDLEGLRVEPYVGRTDDAPGTRIQDGGVAASPHGPEGGTGPGGIGSS